MRPIEILLVEDNPADVKFTQCAFNNSRILSNITVAEDGEKALDVLYKRNGFEEAIKPDLILLDMNLPQIQGQEILKEVKTTGRLKMIPVVIMSGTYNNEDRANADAYKPDSYISKPIDVEKLMNVAATVDDSWSSIVGLPSLDD
jgi:two-component system response regulator